MTNTAQEVNVIPAPGVRVVGIQSRTIGISKLRDLNMLWSHSEAIEIGPTGCQCASTSPRASKWEIRMRWERQRQSPAKTIKMSRTYFGNDNLGVTGAQPTISAL